MPPEEYSEILHQEFVDLWMGLLVVCVLEMQQYLG